MSTWNHRLYRDSDGTIHFKEVHYDDNGAPMGATDIFTCGDDVAEMVEMADRLKAACALPVLSDADFKDTTKKTAAERRDAIIADLIHINPYPKD